MAKEYKQLTLFERNQIQTGLNQGLSFHQIADLLGRPCSTIPREVRKNRHMHAFKTKEAPCRQRNWCKRVNVCAICLRPNTFCVNCDERSCRDVCPVYAAQTVCDVLIRAPWVCNACSKNRYGCNRQNRNVYDAKIAQKASDERRSISRLGIDMPQDKAAIALSYINKARAFSRTFTI